MAQNGERDSCRDVERHGEIKVATRNLLYNGIENLHIIERNAYARIR